MKIFVLLLIFQLNDEISSNRTAAFKLSKCKSLKKRKKKKDYGLCAIAHGYDLLSFESGL